MVAHPAVIELMYHHRQTANTHIRIARWGQFCVLCCCKWTTVTIPFRPAKSGRWTFASATRLMTADGNVTFKWIPQPKHSRYDSEPEEIGAHCANSPYGWNLIYKQNKNVTMDTTVINKNFLRNIRLSGKN